MRRKSKQPNSGNGGVEILDIGDLLPDDRNARKHTPRNVGMIVNALQEIGTGRSGVIDEKGKVLAGNATLEALAQAGIKRVKVVESNGEEWVVVRRRGLSEKDKRRLALYDNRTAELSGWDLDVLKDFQGEDLLAGLFTDKEWAEFGIDEPMQLDDGPEPQFDKAAELRKQYGVELGQLWQLGDHRLMCGDATKSKDVVQALQGSKPFLMVTDPPYGVEYDPTWRRNIPDTFADVKNADPVLNDNQADWSIAWMLSPAVVAYVWHGALQSATVAASLQGAKYEIRAQIIWRKQMAPITRGHYRWQHEPCWYASRGSSKWSGNINESTVWEILNLNPVGGGGREPQDAKQGLGAQKPVECMARPIRNHGGKDDDVYDPFLGSGTTLIAAEKLNRRCYAIEISPEYTAIALQRWVDLTGGTPKLL
jgi:DNA modification methylase